MDFSFPIRISAAKYPDRPALVYGEQRLTHAELDARIDAVAAGLLGHGAGPGPVASVVLNDAWTVCLYLGLARVGLACVPINHRLHVDEMAYIVEDSGAATLVVDESFLADAEIILERVAGLTDVIVVNQTGAATGRARLEDLAADGAGTAAGVTVDEDAVATIMYTSGTTGFPKGVTRTHRANLANVLNSSIGIPRSADDVELFNLPLFGIGFIQHPMPTLLAGGMVVLDRAFSPERAWHLIEQHRVTFTFLAPTMIDSMLRVERHESVDASSLRAIGVAYEFPRRLRERTLERFGDILINMYGLTEAQLCCTRVGEYAADPSSVGKPMGMARIKLVDDEGRPVPTGTVGEIAFDGPAVMSGYHALPDQTAEAIKDGWVHTGDLGYLDPSGNLHFAGRKKEIIKTGGFSVDPVEIENAILDLEEVREASVVGTPDDHWGEAVVAFVTLAGAAEISEEEILAHCKTRLAGFKVPKRVVFFTSELPKNATGKIERGKLRALLSSAEPAPSTR